MGWKTPSWSRNEGMEPSLKCLECDRFLSGWPIFRCELIVLGRVTHTNITRKKTFDDVIIWSSQGVMFFQHLPPQKWHMGKTVELFTLFIQDIHVCFNVWKLGWRYFPYKSCVCVCFFVLLLNKKWSFWDDSPTNSDPKSTKNSPEN